MKFTNWKTQYDQYKKMNVPPGEKPMGVEEWTASRYRQLKSYPQKESNRDICIFRLGIESQWYAQGQPYYKVHPKLVKQLCKTNLSKVPARFIETPKPYSAVAIRLAEDDPLLTLETQIGPLPANVAMKSMLMIRGSDRTQHDFRESVICLINFDYYRDEGTHNEQQIFNFTPIWYKDEDESVETALDNFLIHTKTDSNKVRVFHHCLALAVTIGFLANSSDALIEPDVLNKLKRKYQEGDGKRRKELAAKSQRRGKIGYNVGNDLMFLGNFPGRLSKPKGDGEGRELSYRHIRSGHPHAVRYGPKKEKVKIVWFRPTEVRPDLPFKPD